MKALEPVLSHWQEIGTPLQAPATTAEVEQLWRQLNQPLSDDVLSLYTSIGGFEELITDDLLWSLWSLKRIESENIARTAGGLAFSDFLINSHLYVLQFESPTRSSVWLEHSPNHRSQLTSSLGEFFERYLDDPASLELWPEKT